MKIVLTICALFFSMITSAASLNKIVIFGDSLSDNGNLYEYMQHQLPLSPPYFKGRFTNGPVWVELLSQLYYPNTSKAHLADYAYGGAGVLEEADDDDTMFTLRRELDSYFLTHQDKADPESMFIVWIGANNYLGVPDDAKKAVDTVILGIQHGLKRLADRGAKHILVVNVPDLGRIPIAREFDAIDRMSYISGLHNSILKNYLDELREQYPDIQWLYFDVNMVFDDMTSDPVRFGFTNVTDTCYEAASLNSVSLKRNSLLKMVSTVQSRQHVEDACKGYLFFDPVHPTAPAHQLMAQRTKKLFDREGVEFKE